MVTKTLTITEEAYKRLARLKRENESFSVVIERITGKKKVKLSDYFGILSKEAGQELEENVKKARDGHKKTRRKRNKYLSGELN